MTLTLFEGFSERRHVFLLEGYAEIGKAPVAARDDSKVCEDD